MKAASVSRRFLGLSAAAAIAVGAAGVGPSSAGADLGSFSALARADGFRAQITLTGFALSDLTDTSGPSAQAKIDSLGSSEGFAALLYPGDTATTLPGIAPALLAPQLGQAPPALPPYPLAIRSNYPGQVDSRAGQGSVQLTAHSGPGASTSRAAAAALPDAGGVRIGTVAADSAVTSGVKGIVADAAETVETVTIAGVLTLGGIRASAHSERPTGTAAPTTRSTFAVDAVTVAGTRVGIEGERLVFPGTEVPIPAGADIIRPLEQAGIHLRYLAPATDGGRVRSAGLSVTVPAKTPSGDTATFTYTFGMVEAQVSGEVTALPPLPPNSAGAIPAAPEPSHQGGDAVASATTAAGEAPSSGPETSPTLSGAPILAPVQGVESPPAPAGGPSIDTAASAAPSVPPGSGVALAPSTAPRGKVVPISTTSSLAVYLVLVVGGAVALVGSLLLRFLAVRLAWTS